MLRSLPIALAALALPACLAASQASRPALAPPAEGHAQIIRRVLPESVRIQLFVWEAQASGVRSRKLVRTASGVCLFDDARAHRSFILTNAHVVDRGGLPADPTFEVVVEGPRGSSTHHAARLLASGAVPDTDLALLEVPGTDVPAARLASDEDPEVGQDVVVIGAPFGRTLSVSGGLVSNLEWSGDGAARRQVMLKTDASIGYGTSGGGVFRVRDGALLGVIEGYRTARVELPVAKETFGFDVPMPGETFAAPAAKIRRFLTDHRLQAILGDGHLLDGLADRNP